MKNILLLFVGIILSTTLVAQQDALSLESIFSSYEYQAAYPQSFQWYGDGHAYTTTNHTADGGVEIVLHNIATDDKQVLVSSDLLRYPESDKPMAISAYSWSADFNKVLLFTNTVRVWRLNTKGDYYVLDLSKKKMTKLGGPDVPDSELMFAKFSPGGDQVAYVLKHDLYIENLNNHYIKRMTHDGAERIINGTFDWAYEEEFFCRDGFQWSPDGQHIAFWHVDATKIRDFLMINNTDSVYSYTIPVQYPKAGENPSAVRIGILSANGGMTKWMQIPGDAENHYLPRMIWHPNSQSVLVQQLNRPQNHNRIYQCDIATGKSELVFEDKDDAWFDVVDDYEFLPDDQSFTWVSQSSGWKSLYTIKDGESKQVTPSDMDMIQLLNIDSKGAYAYFLASPENATQKYLYRSEVDGMQKAERLTPENQPGQHNYDISPDGHFAMHSYSSAGVPTRYEMISLPDHEVIQSLEDNSRLKEKLKSIPKGEMQFFHIPLEGSNHLDALMMKPPDFDPSKKYPVLFYVYGEPWGQTVVDGWQGGNYLYHLYIASQGYIVMSIDNRGTPAPKGREWRKSVYGQIGVLASSDQAHGLQYIIDQYPYVDPDRIAIWGWSGGGSMTLNALFRYPDLYQTGISVAPVANQLLYDNIYQERYSGVPQDMPESYQKGSPINFAKNLEGNLLLIHGTGDDNVHYQNTELLINELVRNNKLFSLMIYPNRSHGIYEGKNTSLHLRRTMFDYLIKNTPPGGK